MPLPGLKPVGLFDAYICIRDEKAQGSSGGTFTSGAWRTRDLNTKHADTHNLASIASNQITLQPGTYYCRARAAATSSGTHRLRIRNITDGADLVVGDSGYHSPQGGANSLASPGELSGRFSITAPKVIELQHQCSDTLATSGFGVANNFTDVVEIYAVVELWRELV